VIVTCTSTLFGDPACLSPPRSMTSMPSSPQSQQVYLFYPQGYSVLFRYFYRHRFCRQSSKDSERIRRLSGLHGKTCYINSCVTISVPHFTVLLFAPRLLPSNGLPNGLPPRAPDLLLIPNMFGLTLEGNLVAAKKSLTCLLRPGTQSSRFLPTCPIRMGLSSVSTMTLDIRSVSCSLVPHWRSLISSHSIT
jgi:hypothetical protein